MTSTVKPSRKQNIVLALIDLALPVVISGLIQYHSGTPTLSGFVVDAVVLGISILSIIAVVAFFVKSVGITVLDRKVYNWRYHIRDDTTQKETA